MNRDTYYPLDHVDITWTLFCPKTKIADQYEVILPMLHNIAVVMNCPASDSNAGEEGISVTPVVRALGRWLGFRADG